MKKSEDNELDQTPNFKRHMKVALIIFGVVELIVTLFVVIYMKKY